MASAAGTVAILIISISIVVFICKRLTDASIEHGKAVQVLSKKCFEYATVIELTGYININLNIRIE